MAITKVDCKYGAPCGRPIFTDGLLVDDKIKVKLYRVRIDSGGYDTGGAYWGIGQPLYCIEGEEFEDYTRAIDRVDAKEFFKGKYGDKFKFFGRE